MAYSIQIDNTNTIEQKAKCLAILCYLIDQNTFKIELQYRTTNTVPHLLHKIKTTCQCSIFFIWMNLLPILTMKHDICCHTSQKEEEFFCIQLVFSLLLMLIYFYYLKSYNLKNMYDP